MPCIFGHSWQPVSARTALIVPKWAARQGLMDKGWHETTVLMRCAKCGAVDTKTLDGQWTLADIRGGDNAAPTR